MITVPRLALSFHETHEGRTLSPGHPMRLNWSKSLAVIAVLAACGCGSETDLVIGSQAEASVVFQEAGPDSQEGGHIGSCADGALRDAGPIDVSPPDGGCPSPSLCAALKAALLHRFSFTGVGTAAIDSVGSAHATVVNAELRGDGNLELAGGWTDQYVDLPNGIVKVLTNATFEAWVTWSGCGGWERVFDFGDAGGGENVRGYASTTLYLTPQSMNGRDVMFGAFKRADEQALNETRTASNQPLQAGPMVQIVLVVDDASNLMTLYRNGAFEGSVAFPDSLSMLNDVNNWIGRSQYVADPSFSGTLHEFRIYNAALSAAEVQASFVAGTDPAFLE
jgi:hypothetical protein